MSDTGLRTQKEMLAVAALLAVASLLVLYPFLDAIIMGVATAYLLRFAHDWLNSYIDNDLLSSVVVISAVFAVISIGLYLFINNFFDILAQLNQFSGSLREGIVNVIELLNLSESFQQNVENFLSTVSDRLTNNMISTFTSIPAMLIDLAIFFVTAIFLYRDRSKIESQVSSLVESLPEAERTIAKSLIESVDSIFRGVFMTHFLVAFVLGVISAIGFYGIAVLTSPIPYIPLWAILIAIAALLPLVAAFMFYVPLGGYYIISGAPLKGVLIIVFGILLINVLTEIFLRPYIGSKQMDEHPLVIFLGFLAGPLVLGIKGLIMGPLLLILTKEFLMNFSNVAYGEEN
jgi:predicted PurR-regulated permease PerM